MVARKKYLGHRQSFEHGGTRILRIFEKSRAETLFLDGLLAAQYAVDVPRKRVYRDHARQFPARQNVVTYRQFLVDVQFDEPLVHALVTSAYEQQFFFAAEFDDFLLRKSLSSRRKVYSLVLSLRIDGIDAIVQRLNGHYHARASAERIVVRLAVLVL